MIMDNYIKKYCGDFDFAFAEHISLKFAKILIDIDVYEAQKTIDGIFSEKLYMALLCLILKHCVNFTIMYHRQ